MGAIDLVKELIAAGATFETDGKRVKWRAESGVVKADALAEMMAQKAAVIDFLISEKTVPLVVTKPKSAEIFILAAIRAGRKTPGAIATATRLGATTTYQELDRMARGGGADDGAGWQIQLSAGGG